QILFKEKITSQKNYLKTESEYKTATARFSGLKKQLEMLNISINRLAQGELVATSIIYSPIDGSITSVNVSKGTYVSPASAIMEIVDHSHIHLELSVFEKDIMKIKKEQEIQFKIPEASEEIFEAKVHLVGTSIGKNRSIKVHGHLKDETANNFLTGMYVEARIITDNREYTALPNEAVVLMDDLSYVLLLEEENENEYVFKQIEIEAGTTSDNYTAILNNEQFDQANEFLVNGAFHLIKDL
ncbi:MAG: efflux RND transporter periplasmic adaptor subunit, partial [Flavobacteriaceae bacterium]